MHQVEIASNVNVARTALSETRGQNWIQRQFRGEKKPSKHHFKPSEQTRRTSLKETNKQRFKSFEIRFRIYLVCRYALGDFTLTLYILIGRGTVPKRFLGSVCISFVHIDYLSLEQQLTPTINQQCLD